MKRLKIGRIDFDLDLCHRHGVRALIGVDEAGRGAGSGPIVFGIVKFRSSTLESFLSEEWAADVNDSKRLSSPVRERLADILWRNADEVEVACFAAEVVDSIGVRGIMRTLLMWREEEDALVVFDGKVVNDSRLRWLSIVRADSLSFTVASASLVAKTVRDALMEAYSHHFPYSFWKHKGYLTAQHFQEVSEFGLTQLHRRSFIKPNLFGGDTGEY